MLLLIIRVSNFESPTYMLMVHQRFRRTDRQTDGRKDRRTTYDSNTALALRASRGKNINCLRLVAYPN